MEVTVREIELPAMARTLTRLERLDYTDAFAVETAAAPALTAEAWARTMLEGAPAETRAALRRGWAALGLELGSVEDGNRVLGWEVRADSDDVALLHAGSRFGLHGEVLFERGQGELLFATLVQLANPLARTVWAAVAPTHRGIVRGLLKAGVRRGSVRGGARPD